MEETTTVKRHCHSLHTPTPPVQLLIYLPFDVIVEILCRLPVKSLRQLCCVCKSWNSLISNDLKFAKKHLRISTKHRYLVTTRSITFRQSAINSYPLDSIPFHSILTSKGTQIDYPSFTLRNRRHRLIDSCDGLLCFLIYEKFFYIYNPSIRKEMRLPCLHIPNVLTCSHHYAFGYDPFVDNYKVISVFSYEQVQDNNGKSEVNVYTLGTDSWRRIQDFPSKIPHGRRGIFVSGTVNWLTYYFSNGFDDLKLTAIVSLHLGKESYQEIPLPDHNVDVNALTLDVMRDCLCMFSQESVDSFIDVWLMKEYGNKDSWVKLIRLRSIGDSGYFPHIGDSGYLYTKILYISDDDNHVLLVYEELDKLKWVVYDCKNNTIASSMIEDLSCLESNVYVESLISPRWWYH